MARACAHREVRAAGGGRAHGAVRQPRHGRHPDALPHAGVGQLEQVERVGPPAEEDRPAVAERPAGQLLVGGGDPRWAHPALDEAAQGRERFPRPLRLRERTAALVDHARAVGPQGLQHVDHAALVLFALPEVAVEARIALPGLDQAHLPRQLVVRLGRGEAVLREQILAVVQQADVHEPRKSPEPAVLGGGLDGGGEVGVALRGRHLGGEVEDPARSRELGHPDHVQHHHVEGRAAALEVDHVELVLLVRGPRERLALHAHPRMLRLEAPQEARDRVGGAEDLGVLEDQRDRPRAGRPLAAAGRQQREEQAGDEERGARRARRHGRRRCRATRRGAGRAGRRPRP